MYVIDYKKKNGYYRLSIGGKFILYLLDKEDLTKRDVIDTTGISMRSINHIFKTLRELGFIKRIENNGKDKRLKYYTIVRG